MVLFPADPARAGDDAVKVGEVVVTATRTEEEVEKIAANVTVITAEEVVVTATRTEEEVEKIAANVTVITAEDIEDSTATTVPQLLEQEAGVLIRDLYGNGTKSTVDMRGFARGINTVIMIDGRKLNEVDLSGVDWNLIPLENIERIEVVRGSGSVLYGDNAMAGVINIITKRGTGEKPEVELGGRVESYDGHSEYLSARGAVDRVGYYLLGKLRESDGYRENSEFRAKDLDAAFNVEVTDSIYAELRGGYHEDHQGFPGGLTRDEIEEDRRQSQTPEDGVDYDQYFYGLTLGYVPAEWVDVEFAFNYNSREFDADFVLWGGNIVRDTDSDELKLKTTFSLGDNLIVAGIDRHHAGVDNTSEFLGSTTVSDIEKTELGYYLQEEYTYREKLVFTLGYRYSDTELEDVVRGDLASGSGVQTFNESAVKGSVAYNYSEGAKAFVSYSRGYRLPTTDELFALDGTIVELDPERADTYEVGVEQPFGDELKAGLTLYYMRVKDELVFNQTTYANENLDRTRHRGAELSFTSKPIDSLSLSGSWTYTRATFESGENQGKTVPLVPGNSGSLGAVYRYWRMRFSAVASYVDERRLDGDLGNNEETLDDYLTVDAKVSYHHKYGEVFVGVNNVLDEEYEDYGVVGFFGNEFYPAPERYYYAGVKIRF
jgi:iron complex outermembrane receptor protein